MEKSLRSHISLVNRPIEVFFTLSFIRDLKGFMLIYNL